MARRPVIRTFAGLKWRLVVNGLTRTRLGFIAALGALAGFGFAGLIALGAIETGRSPHSALAFRAGALGTYLFVFAMWTFGPLLIGVDETVDPTRLALVPLTRSELRRGLVAASLIGFGPVASAIVLAGVLVGFVRGGARGLFVVAAVLVGYALALTASRALATMLVRVQRSRRGRDIIVVAAALVGATLWLGTQIAPRLSASSETRLLDVLRFTPPGWAGQAIVDASHGHLAASAAGIVAAAALAGALLWAWISGVGAILADPGASAEPDVVRTDDDTTEWARGSELRTAVRKELRYLSRSPARRSTTLVAIVFGTGFVALQVFQNAGRHAALVLIAPAAAMFGISAINNQLGHDGASLWVEVVAGAPRRAELVARELSWLPAIVGPSIPAALLVGATTGGWRYVPFAIGLSIAMCGVLIGVGAYTSVRAPILVPDDVNPFLNRQANTSRGCIVGFAAFFTIAVDALVLAPAIVLVVFAAQASMVWLGLALIPVALYSLAVWAIGVTLAVHRLQGREPELIAALQPQ